MSDLDTETNAETATFDHFGQSWTVPTKKHHRHIREAKAIQRREGYLDADDIAQIYLEGDGYERLCDLDVSSAELTDFANAIADAMGIGDSGNSEPSSASS
jgi:hypothetical protein